MGFFENVSNGWKDLCQKTEPTRKAIAKGVGAVVKFVRVLWAYIYKLRGLFLYLPVAIVAIWLACKNLAELPETVGLVLQSTGEFSVMVGRGTAVFCPLLLTALCLLLVVCSKRTLYPWLISVFSLVLPILIQFINMYPA